MRTRCDHCGEDFDGREIKMSKEVREVLAQKGYSRICRECFEKLK